MCQNFANLILIRTILVLDWRKWPFLRFFTFYVPLCSKKLSVQCSLSYSKQEWNDMRMKAKIFLAHFWRTFAKQFFFCHTFAKTFGRTFANILVHFCIDFWCTFANILVALSQTFLAHFCNTFLSQIFKFKASWPFKCHIAVSYLNFNFMVIFNITSADF